MKQTSNYQLPQWEPQDAIRRADFNAAMGSIDGALAAQQADINTRAAKSDLTATNAALNVTSARVAAKAEQSELEAAEIRVTALEKGVVLKKLGTGTTTAANQSLTFDLTGVDMSSCNALLLFVGAPLVNGNYGKLYLQIDGSNFLLLRVYATDALMCMIWLQRVGSLTGVASVSASSEDSGEIPGGLSEVAWTALNSVGVGGTSARGLSGALYALVD